MDEPHRLVVSDPNVMMGKPAVAGTRITVELILEKLSAGETIEQLLDAHPQVDPISELPQHFAVVTPTSLRIRRSNE
jgi:uncharacterized protein (DUF433 family)